MSTQLIIVKVPKWSMLITQASEEACDGVNNIHDSEI